MEKAARAVRRSSIRFLSLGGGHSDLHVLISQIKDTRNSAKAFRTAQTAASHDLQRWASNEQNRAIQDVSNKLTELNVLWNEVQKDFIGRFKECQQMFEMVLEGEKLLSQGRSHLTSCEQKEQKVRRELKKAAKVASSDTIRILEARLTQAERSKEVALIEVSDRIRENEAVKLIRVKQGLLRVSEAYIEMGRKCSIIFETQRDIAHQLPDVHGRALEDIKYDGSCATSYYVDLARERLQNYRRQSHQLSSIPSADDPPPPYSVVESELDTSEESSSSRFSSPQVGQNISNTSTGSFSSPQTDQNISSHSSSSHQHRSTSSNSNPSPHQHPDHLPHSYSAPQIQAVVTAPNIRSYYHTPPAEDHAVQLNNLSENSPYISAEENYDSDDPEVNVNYYLGPERMHVSDQTTIDIQNVNGSTVDYCYPNQTLEPVAEHTYPRQQREPAVGYIHHGQEGEDCEEITGAMGGTQIW
ncbi:hypothetical protein ScPMuIL_015428 [Solemya velum]